MDNGQRREIAANPATAKGGPTVVGIGASAGGLAALKTFLSKVPADSGLSFVVVVHLLPDHESHLAQLLQPYIQVPVEQIDATTLLECNHVYIIPPNANLNAIDTHLRLSKLGERRQERAPIDHFFRTLATTHDGHAVAVVLTGTGSDGTLGIKDIKANGGVVIVQDPAEAEYDGMPQSAIATGLADFILPVAQIPDKFLRFHRTKPKLYVPVDDGEAPPDERILLQKIFAHLRARTDCDFSCYKRSTIMRPIARRMQLNYIEDLQHYVERLRETPEEVRALADDLLITVTHFFRDTEVFEKLANGEMSRLFSKRDTSNGIRVWSVGCSTGEEAYSIAMLLVEEASRRKNPPHISVFASDLHSRSLEQAREGFYPGDIDADVSPERLRRFFQKENGGYRIRKEIRELLVFAPHNVLADPPFSKLDFIACRNLLIYLERDVQQDVIELFHYALNPDGVLLLGPAETMSAPDLFRVEDKRLCFFRKRNVPPRDPRLPVFPLTHIRFSGESFTRQTAVAPDIAHGVLHQRMAEQFAPPSILVNSDNRIVHFSEHVGRYLVMPGGEPTTNAVKMVRDELRMDLQSLLHQVREKKVFLDSRPIAVRFNGSWSPVVLHLRLSREKDQEGYVLVIFEERESQHGDISDLPLTESTAEVGALQAEISQGRQRLQTVIEEYEASREEMKASNEELQSTNEELRSTMEELETSKEETQSINEELQTVNHQNRYKVEELAQLSSDLQNLLIATDIATLFLDRNFRILRFTPKLGDLFNVRVSDRGRPISDLTHRLGYPDLHQDAETVLSKLVPIEREVQDDAGRWYLARIHPYRSNDDHIEGVVVTFIDIHVRKVAEEALMRANVDLKYFSYAVSHDMQEPLRMVTSYTQLLERSLIGSLDAEKRKYMNYAAEGARRMEALLHDLRQYWSVDEESFGEELPTDCNKVLSRTLEYLESQVAESGVVITHDQLPKVAVEFYPLTLLFQNLISNAIKYRRPDSPLHLRIAAVRSGISWDFSIADNGMGISADHLEVIFAPFKRLHGTEVGGTGLGLAMCRKIVERYRGRIWAVSTLGQGSTFHFTLPALDGKYEE